jgi:hypothetical protein
MSTTDGTVIRMNVLQDDHDVVSTVAPIRSINSEELRPPPPFEYAIFGPDACRLQNLPRLLDQLFTSASGELM